MSTRRIQPGSQVRALLAVLLLVVGLAAPALAFETPYREVLPNGLNLVILPSRSSPTVSVNVFVKVGSFEETPETSGITHFYEHLFFRGTPRLSGYQFKRAIEAAGGSTNASTTRDFTHFFINLPRTEVIPGMTLLADALVNAELSKESVDQERKAVLEEYRLGTESPPRIISSRIYEMAYGQHPYSRPIIGTEDNISHFQSEDFQKFRDAYHSPERTSVVIVGDVEVAEILPKARELFGTFRREKAAPESSAPLPELPSGEVRSAEFTPGSRNCYVVLGYRGPSVKDRPDIYRTDVMTFLLGVGRGSLMSKDLVDKNKSLEAGVDFLTQRYPGLIVVSGVGASGAEEQLRADMLATIERVRNGQFTDRDLERAKSFLRSTYILGNETNAGKADSLGFYAAIDQVDFAMGYLAEIGKVTRQDVVDVARKYLGPGYYCLILKAGEDPSARRRGEDEERSSR